VMAVLAAGDYMALSIPLHHHGLWWWVQQFRTKSGKRSQEHII
jgi:hypothetical protein